jgi:WD40 repeat protein
LKTQVVCNVQVNSSAEELQFTWSGPSWFPPYSLSDRLYNQFRKKANWARTCLSTLTGIAPPVKDGDVPGLWEDLLGLARAGRSLHNLIFTMEVAGTEKVRDWLRKLTEKDQVRSLEIICDKEPWIAPWGLVYDDDPETVFKDVKRDKAGFARVLQPFWGHRHNLGGGLPAAPTERDPLAGPPDVLLVIDPDVDANLGDTVRGRLEALASARTGSARVVQSLDALRGEYGKPRPHVIYWVGHATPDYLFLKATSFSPDDLSDHLRNLGRQGDLPASGGLVFLNACETAGEPKNPRLGSFLEEFRGAGYSCVIATEVETPAALAVRFGLDVLTAFLERGLPIGPVLQKLRRDPNYAPLGLIYGHYGPPDLRVDLARTSDAETARSGALLPGGKTPGAKVLPGDLPRLPDKPFLPLTAYTPAERALFAGRDADVRRFVGILGRDGVRVVILHGESGVGKSSFLQAGVVPYLHRSAGFDRGGVFSVRAADDPARQIADKLSEFAATSFEFRDPDGDVHRVDLKDALVRTLGSAENSEVRTALQGIPGALGRLMGALGSALPFTPVLVIDQAEEVFTLSQDESARDRALAMLVRAAEAEGTFKVILSLRTEFLGRLDGALKEAAPPHGIINYLLLDLDHAGLVAFLERPTVDHALPHASEVPRVRYRFRLDPGVADAFARDVLRAGRKDGVLPLAQVLGGQLWERIEATRERSVGGVRVVTLDDLDELDQWEGNSVHAGAPRFTGALTRHVEQQIEGLLGPDVTPRATFKNLLADLTLSQVDGTLTTALLRPEKLKRLYPSIGGRSFEDVLPDAGARRLLRATEQRDDDGEVRSFLSLGHDALARVVFPWKQERERERERRLLRLAEARRYNSDMLLAQNAWDTRSLDRLEQLLDEQNPETSPGGFCDFRGFEWFYWNHLTRVRMKTLRGHEGQVSAVVYSRDGLRIASASHDGTVRVWDAATGRVLQVLKGHRGGVWGVSYSTDGHFIASGSSDKTVRVWDAATGEVVRVMSGHGGGVRCVSYGRDGRQVASASEDATVRVWEVSTGDQPLVLTGHGAGIWGVSFSPDGRYVASGSSDKTVRVWDLSTGDAVHVLKGHGDNVRGVSYSPNGKRLAAASADRTVRVWDAVTGDELLVLKGHARGVLGVSYSHDGRRLASVSEDATVRVWHTLTGEEVFVLKGHGGWVRGVSFSPDGRHLASAASDATVRVWDAARGGEALALRNRSGSVLGVSYSRDGSRIAAASVDGKVRVWDAKTGARTFVLSGHASGVAGVSYSPDGRRIASASVDGTVRLWDAATGDEVLVLEDRGGGVLGVSFGPDGRQIAVASDDGAVRVWDTVTGGEMRVLKGHEGRVLGVSFSHEGGRIASASSDKTVRVWDAANGKELRVLTGHRGWVLGVSYSPEGGSIASASADGTVRVWHALTGEEVFVLKGHGGVVRAVSYSTDGRRIASASDDKTVRVWDAETGGEMLVLKGHDKPVNAASFRHDDRCLASASDDGSVIVWDASDQPPVWSLHSYPKRSSK